MNKLSLILTSTFLILHTRNIDGFHEHHVVIIPYERGRSYDVKFVENTILMTNHDTRKKHFSYRLPRSCFNKQVRVQKRDLLLYIDLACPYTGGIFSHRLFHAIRREKEKQVAWI